MNSSFDNNTWVYWERQGTDRLCGVHCINSLLQGPFYTEFSLAEIARELDAKEKELVLEQGVDSKEYLTYLQEGSNNVADDGNYNIQVISEGLKRVGDLRCDSIDSSDLKDKDLSTETGFICNSAAHWFPIRKINGKWYNLNSTNREGPELISDFYLSAFLNSVRENGYIIFVVQGDYPHYDRSFFGETQFYQKWFTEKQCQEIHERNMKKKNYKLNIGGTDERDLEQAMENSMKEGGGHQQKGGQGDNYDDEYERAIKNSMEEEEDKPKEEEPQFKAFQGSGVSLSTAANHSSLEDYYQKWNAGDDPELAFAIKLSMSEQFETKPKEGLDTITLNFRLPGGQVESWVFYQHTQIEELYDFVKVKLPEEQIMLKVKISTSYPKKALVNMGDTLASLGLDNNDMLVVEQL